MDDAQDTWRQLLGGQVPGHQGGAVPRRDQLRLRLRAVGDRAVLLSGGPQGLSGSRVLRRAGSQARRARRLRAGLRSRPRARPPRADSDRCRSARCASVRRRTRARATRCRSGWSSRPIATPASGAITPTRAAAASSSIRTTPRRASTPPRPSATTASSRCRAAASRPERFTHGTSQQRVEWFKRGMNSRGSEGLQHVPVGSEPGRLRLRAPLAPCT